MLKHQGLAIHALDSVRAPIPCLEPKFRVAAIRVPAHITSSPGPPFVVILAVLGRRMERVERLDQLLHRDLSASADAGGVVSGCGSLGISLTHGNSAPALG